MVFLKITCFSTSASTDPKSQQARLGMYFKVGLGLPTIVCHGDATDGAVFESERVAAV